MHGRVDFRRLAGTGNQEAAAAMPLKIVGNRFEQAFPLGRRLHFGPLDHRLQLVQETADFTPADRQAVVGRRARDRVAALDRIQAVHPLVRLPPLGELPDRGQRRRVIAEQIGVEADDHAGPIEAELGPIRGPECLDAPQPLMIARKRLVFIPRHLRKRIEKLLAQSGDRRRTIRIAEHGEARALLLPQPAEMPPVKCFEPFPILRRPPDARLAVDHLPTAVRVVETQDGRLGQRVGRPQALRMQGLPSILIGRPSNAVTSSPIAAAREVHRRGIPLGQAGSARSGRSAKGMISSFSQRQPDVPARANEAPINWSHRRRLIPCGSASFGNSASSSARNSGAPASSAMLRQGFRPFS